jgi:hypothetical protein
MKKSLSGGRLALALGIVLLTAVASQGRSTGAPGYVPVGAGNVASASRWTTTRTLVSVSPGSGTKLTTFTVTAILLGSGYFTVKDADGNQLNVKLEVVT